MIPISFESGEGFIGSAGSNHIFDKGTGTKIKFGMTSVVMEFRKLMELFLHLSHCGVVM